LGLGVDCVDVGADHSSRQQYLISVADEAVGFVVADSLRFEVTVSALGPMGDQAAVASHEVGSDDDAVPVVLEPLGGEDAADLFEATFGGRPEGRWRSITDVTVILGLDAMPVG